MTNGGPAYNLCEDPLSFGCISYLVLLVATIAIVFRLQYKAFGSVEKARRPESVASFFHLREVVDSFQYKMFALAAAFPLSILFGIVSWRGDYFNPLYS